MTSQHANTINALIDEGSRAAAAGDNALAQRTLKRARELDPVAFELELARRAWTNQGPTQAETFSRRQKVISRLGALAIAAPDRSDAWLLLAECLDASGNHEGSLKATASGLKRDPLNADLWVLRTQAQIALHQLQSASRSLRHSVKLAPTHEEVETLVHTHPVCTQCHALFPHAGAEYCAVCGADGPARGAPVASARAQRQSKFDVYFPKVRDIVAASLDMPDRIKVQLTLDTLLKRHLKRTNQQCALVLKAMSMEFGSAFDAPLFNSAVIGFLDILIADLIRAIDPREDRTIDTGIRNRVLSNT